jgi:ABC-type multidrug transport system ATPase subunit
VRTFSGGMQQRLSLALALLANTPVLLLDEPSASLDRDGQGAFFDIVARLRRRGHTLLLASHRPEEVEALSDRVLYVDRGRLEPAPAPRAHGARVVALAVWERR